MDNVDFPDPESPVNQISTDRWFNKASRCSRVTFVFVG